MYWVYILSNKNKTIYVGITNNLQRRLYEHKNHLIEGFTKRYFIDKLVYFEEYSDSYSAIKREKQIKGWTRIKKIELIEEFNSNWEDLAEKLN